MLMVIFAGVAEAVDVRVLGNRAKAELGATHEVTITHADLTETTTNTAETLASFAVVAKQGVKLVAMHLVTPFDTISTNYTTSTLLTVGDGTDADLYLTSTELNTDGTEVYLKFGRLPISTYTSGTFVTNVADATANALTNVTASTGTFMTNVTLQTGSIGGTNVVTNVVILTTTAVTGVTTSGQNYVTGTTATTTTAFSSVSVTDTHKLYTGSDTVDFTFTPNAEESLSQLSAGEVKIYLHVADAR
jgi:hypothetical protein